MKYIRYSPQKSKYPLCINIEWTMIQRHNVAATFIQVWYDIVKMM